jgi:hypothetical protein
MHLQLYAKSLMKIASTRQACLGIFTLDWRELVEIGVFVFAHETKWAYSSEFERSGAAISEHFRVKCKCQQMSRRHYN